MTTCRFCGLMRTMPLQRQRVVLPLPFHTRVWRVAFLFTFVFKCDHVCVGAGELGEEAQLAVSRHPFC